MKTIKNKRKTILKKEKKERKTKKRIGKKRGGNPKIKARLSRLLNNPEKRMKNMIYSVCKDRSDRCIALGPHYNQIIYNFFDKFSDFSMVNTLGTKVISKGSNGFIWYLPFVKESYEVGTILKCSNSDLHDNLYYEYYVGKHFINKYINTFPCFIETYETYKLKPITWNRLSTLTKNIPLNSTNIEKYTGGFEDSCTNSRYLSVLIQYFPSDSLISFKMLCHSYYNNVKYELRNICYQVIFVLCALKDSYTHYDLHWENVYLYRPYEEGKYIEMNYHLNNGKIISFPSEYIVKIIDYGRNYFNNGETNTKQILETQICPNPKCQPDCGFKAGYTTIQGNVFDPTIVFYNILPNIPNQSVDLRFMTYLNNYFRIITGFNVTYTNTYGTPELLESGLPDKQINNIYDAKLFLEENVELNTYYRKNIGKKYNEKWEKVAIINVYEDGREYEYIQLPSREDRKLPTREDRKLPSRKDRTEIEKTDNITNCSING
jgi:hypothetical protein